MCKALIGQPDRDSLVIVDDAHPHRLQRLWRTPVPLTTPTLPGSPARCQGFAYPGDASPLAPFAPLLLVPVSPAPPVPRPSAPLRAPSVHGPRLVARGSPRGSPRPATWS